MKNTFQSKKNLIWFLGKCFPGKFGKKTLFGSSEKFRNVILFADYIKFKKYFPTYFPLYY